MICCLGKAIATYSDSDVLIVWQMWHCRLKKCWINFCCLIDAV